MKWVVAIAAVAVVILLIRRRKYAPAPRPASGRAPARARQPEHSTDRQLSTLKPLEGANCIYEEGAYIISGRLLQVHENATGLVFTMQTLKADGLSDSPDERLNLETAWNQFEHSNQVVHARQMHWRLFFKPEVVQKVHDLGRSHTDHKSIKRLLLEQQMT